MSVNWTIYCKFKEYYSEIIKPWKTSKSNSLEKLIYIFVTVTTIMKIGAANFANYVSAVNPIKLEIIKIKLKRLYLYKNFDKPEVRPLKGNQSSDLFSPYRKKILPG